MGEGVSGDDAWQFVPLNKSHDRAGFSCGVDALDLYLRERARQDERRSVARVYVLAAGARIGGYYTLSAAELSLADLDHLVDRLPRYPSVPCIRIGRLAVALEMRGRGVGSMLVADAVARTRDSGVGVVGMTVDAKDDEATAFYARLGFVALDDGRTLFAPVKTLERALE